jgi:hypothetical protein
VRAGSPLRFEGSGRGCVHDACPEGKMTCGRPYDLAEIDGAAAARS